MSLADHFPFLCGFNNQTLCSLSSFMLEEDFCSPQPTESSLFVILLVRTYIFCLGASAWYAFMIMYPLTL